MKLIVSLLLFPLFFLLLLSSSMCHPFNNNNDTNLLASPSNYIIQAVYTWIPAFCATNRCKRNVEEFKLHGLWPIDSNGRELPLPPGYVPVADVSEFWTDAFKQQVAAYWWSLYISKSNERFWTDEWNDHGARTDKLALVYFKLGIELGKKYNLVSNRLRANPNPIVPKENVGYSKIQIVEKISRGFNTKNVYISCTTGPKGSILLYEVYVCYNSAGTSVVPCPADNKARGCPDPTSQTIIYLPFKRIPGSLHAPE